jgi:predicted GH43/DUF377 family glycosyl hydrolase
MKKIFFLMLCLFVFQTTYSQPDTGQVYMFCYFKDNGQDGLHLAYSNDGYTWKSLFNDSSVLKPTVSKDKLMRDPCIIRGGDGKFHMVWTVSWNDKGIGYASSTDLISWSEQKFLPVMAHEEKVRNSWAPEITYDTRKKRYIVYWASTIEGRFVSTDTAAESKYNHRIYYTTTKDFVKFKKTRLLIEPSFSIIDATIQQDNNRYVMFLKNETRFPVEKNIRVAFSKKLTGPYSTPGKSITGGYWAEGPTAMKIGEEWIVYFDKYTMAKYGAVSSTDLINWQDISDKVTFPKGARHGTVFTITQQEFQHLLFTKKF